jgi:DNA-directed RNA polymerase specialized sigma24 family protein/CheY-like chemotaxis protein
MSLSQHILPHLPYLRRFARALTGSQNSGDTYVAAMLEALIADPAVATRSSNLKTTLFHTLCRLWSSSGINERGETMVPGWELNVQEKLNTLSGQARQAFLLRAVEGFSNEQIGEILSKKTSDVESLHALAHAEIAEMLACDVLIIEDEPLIAMDIEDIVTSLGHRAVGIARTQKDAVAKAAKSKPQLVLSDIQLADGSSGIDAVNDILKSFDVPVIFITAFPERLLTGDKPEPAFLITKPFTADMVKAVVAQALFFDVRAGASSKRAATSSAM